MLRNGFWRTEVYISFWCMEIRGRPFSMAFELQHLRYVPVLVRMIIVLDVKMFQLDLTSGDVFLFVAITERWIVQCSHCYTICLLIGAGNRRASRPLSTIRSTTVFLKMQRGETDAEILSDFLFSCSFCLRSSICTSDSLEIRLSQTCQPRVTVTSVIYS